MLKVGLPNLLDIKEGKRLFHYLLLMYSLFYLFHSLGEVL